MCNDRVMIGTLREMALLLGFTGPRKIDFIEQADDPLQPGTIRVATLYSGISAGTELTQYRGTNPKLVKRWDEQRGVFVTDDDLPSDPPAATGGAYKAHQLREVIGVGYEQVGRITEVGEGVTGLVEGDVVCGAWGHRSGVVLPVERVVATVPTHLDPQLAVFSRVGAVALNAILDAQINLGETVAVFGAGVIGQIVAQMARLSGAEVVVSDLAPSRLDLLQQIDPGVQVAGPGDRASDVVRNLTDGRGADVCIEATGSTAALHEAIRACAHSSRVVAVGFYQGPAPNLFLGEEFHHNRVDVIASQFSGVAPSLQHRWNRHRLNASFLTMLAAGRLTLEPLITHVRPFGDAPELFALLDEHPEKALQVVLSFPENGAERSAG